MNVLKIRVLVSNCLNIITVLLNIVFITLILKLMVTTELWIFLLMVRPFFFFNN